jgi:hypothetical protein
MTTAIECRTVEVGVEVYDQFEDELIELWRRDDIVVPDPVGVARLLRHLLESNGLEAPAARVVLAQTGIRRQWNHIFAVERARRLAEELRPFLEPPVLDVLAGDCTVSQALIRHGIRALRAVERLWQYPDVDWSGTGVVVSDIDSGPWCGQGERTALISAVLHHEPDPVALLEELANSSPARRWVIVENCIDSRYGHEFHRFMDEFFNRCLNQFHCSCVPEHRTAEEWIDVLTRYGRVSGYRELRNIPGIPFPYQVLVVHRP